MEQTKDYSLLRPFDLEAAKSGERIVLNDAGNLVERTFVTGPDDHGYFVTKTSDGWFRFGKDADYRMAPLAWVEGKPVYKGDVLYFTMPTGSEKFVAHGESDCGSRLWTPHETWMTIGSLTWNPPKVKREGYFALYPTLSLTEEQIEAIKKHTPNIQIIKHEWYE